MATEPFPRPLKINNRNYWRLKSLLEFEGKHDEASRLSAKDDVLLPARDVCRRYSVCSMTLWRWCRAAEAAEAVA